MINSSNNKSVIDKERPSQARRFTFSDPPLLTCITSPNMEILTINNIAAGYEFRAYLYVSVVVRRYPK